MDCDDIWGEALTCGFYALQFGTSYLAAGVFVYGLRNSL
jgi:hypothetical protein